MMLLSDIRQKYILIEQAVKELDLPDKTDKKNSLFMSHPVPFIEYMYNTNTVE